MRAVSSVFDAFARARERLGETRYRALFVAAVLAMQTVFFFVFLHRPLEMEEDNLRYELPGWNLAQGKGFVLPFDYYAEDTVVYDWVCSRHPEECKNGEYPVALYPPGYSFFIALVYLFTGRKLVALFVANYLLLLLVFFVFERVAAKMLRPRAYVLAMVAAAGYPFLAHQAGIVMSDHLHGVLYFLAFAAWLLIKPGVFRGIAFGGILGLSTFTRPYGFLVVPAVFAFLFFKQKLRKEALAFALALALPFCAWTARNAYQFGRLVPMTTAGAGLLYYGVQLEVEVGQPYTKEASKEHVRRYFSFLPPEARARGEQGKSILPYMLRPYNQAIGEAGKAWWKQNPHWVVAMSLYHAPKLWVSLGTDGGGYSRAWPLLLLGMGGMAILGAVGAYRLRKDPRWIPVILGVLLYWLFLVPFPGEARRTLPLRLSMMLFAAYVVGDFTEKKAPSETALPVDPPRAA